MYPCASPMRLDIAYLSDVDALPASASHLTFPRMSRPQLNLPPCALRIELRDGVEQAFCLVRKRWVVLTPEEWVRQHVVAYLCLSLGYPVSLMRLEKRVEGGKRLQRSDVTAHGNDGRPLLLVECKAPDEPIDRETLFQATRYNRHIGAGHILLSNGLVHQCCRIDEGVVNFLDAIPLYEHLNNF